jgi:hypothetical protein
MLTDIQRKKINLLVNTAQSSFEETMNEEDAKIAMISLIATYVTLMDLGFPLTNNKYVKVLRVLANILEEMNNITKD